MIRSVCAVFFLTIALGAASLASAQQQTWDYQGVSFTPRVGWCAGPSTDLGGYSTFVAKPCDEILPQVSTTTLFQPNDPQAQTSVAELTSRTLAWAASPAGGEHVAASVRRSGPACTTSDFSAESDPIPGILAVGTMAAVHCPQGTGRWHNIGLFVRARDGAIWVIGLDFGDNPITPDDVALVRSMIASIGSQ